MQHAIMLGLLLLVAIPCYSAEPTIIAPGVSTEGSRLTVDSEEVRRIGEVFQRRQKHLRDTLRRHLSETCSQQFSEWRIPKDDHNAVLDWAMKLAERSLWSMQDPASTCYCNCPNSSG